MVLTAHQPVYMPWLGLFHKIALADEYIYLNTVQYQVGDFNNRNKVKTPQGTMWLSVPIFSKGYMNKKFYEMKINNNVDWQKKHFHALFYNYKRAKYFQNYIGFFEDLYNQDWEYLTDLNEYMLRWFLDVLKIKTKFLKASDFQFTGKKSGLVLDMCKQTKADTYIFGAQGKNYAESSDFESQGIKLYFQNYQHPIYPQLWGDFIKYLSVIDLLFNAGTEKSRKIIGL